MWKCRNSTLIPRRARSARLEGWPQAPCLWPSFETRPLAAPQDEVKCIWLRPLSAVLFIFAISLDCFAAERKLDIGRAVTSAEIAGWDIDVRPDGQGLPPGKGSVRNGEQVYITKGT